MDLPVQPPQKRRPINQQLKLEYQIIEYAKKSVLSSKIILDEDFEGILDAPSINLPPIVKNYSSAMNTVVSAFGVILLKRFNVTMACLPIVLLPAGYEIVELFKRCYNRRQCCKQIDRFVDVLGTQAALNRKVIKHLHTRINAINELGSKVSDTVIKMIQEDDAAFAKFAAYALYKACTKMQAQTLIQSTYSGSNYQIIGNWLLECIGDDATYLECTSYIEKLSELYILLASNILSSSVFGLEQAMWKSHIDFQIVFHTIVTITNDLKESIRSIEAFLKKIFYDFETPTRVPSKLQVAKQSSVYKDAMDDCKCRLRIVFDMVKTIESQKPKTRCIFLEEMLTHYAHSTELVRNVLRYERSRNNVASQNGGDAQREKVEQVKRIEGKRVVDGDDDDEEIGSDDEMFAYSPHDSDDEFDNQQRNKGGSGDVDKDSADGQAAAAIQNLMLQELRDRMKDVRRIKIARTKNGDLIVQERPITLQESGGQVQSPMEQVQVELPAAFPPIPPPPPMLPRNLLNEENGGSPSGLHKELMTSIASVAIQMKRTEDVFGCAGEEYVNSDEDR